jgi:hypothetical protein
MSKDAVALRGFRVGENPGDWNGEGAVIRGLPDNQFTDWEAAGLVRAATDADLSPPVPADPGAPPPAISDPDPDVPPAGDEG